ncbi:hypothetical protein LLEC1_02843 [Akanthomyces lecanii]|uniref:Uncharacterized protein n=1 Tax=Cordyceps confragosa TaxID=2714763 RepID=A0A179IIM4_CORDF|nr:hypothetical protein LLEC1_02843 [Akanthomyces lecanii]
MAATQSDQVEEHYPSYKERRIEEERVILSEATRRLYWPLEGDFPSAISVLKPLDEHDRLASKEELDERVPLFQADTSSWHEIALLPLTEPKVSSIEFSMRDLDQWEGNWLSRHRDHADTPLAELVTYGDLGDEVRPFRMDGEEDGNWEEDSDTEFVIKCCGTDRPLGKGWKKIQVTPTAGHNFVSIRDYVRVVHPWLMASREDIIEAKRVDFESDWAPGGSDWVVTNPSTTECEVQLKRSWTRGLVPAKIDAEHQAKILQLIGRGAVR